MAGPWEKYQRQVAQPWEKYRAAAEGNAWERGTLLPVEVNKLTGERRLAVPQVAIDLGNAFQAPEKARTGGYGMEIDPETGRPTTITNDLIGDALGVSGVALPGAPLLSKPITAAGREVLPGAARRIVLRGLAQDQIPVGELPSRLAQLGPDAMVGDLGPRLQKQTAAVATMPGAGQKAVVDALAGRQQRANGRILAGVNEALGAAPIPSRVAAGISENKAALGPYYDDAFNDALAVDTADIAANLDALAVNLRGPQQKAVADVRRMLNVVGEDVLDPNPRTLFSTREAIDGLMKSETNPKVVRQLSLVRKQVDDALAGAVPGLKDVDARYAELARQNEALDSGAAVLGTDKDALRPSEVVESMVSGAVPSRNMVGPSAVPFRLSQGVRAEIDRLVGTKANDLQALRRAVGGEGDWNREKLVAVFGPEKADRLLAIIDREIKYAETANQALSGSRTQVLKAAQDEIQGKQSQPGVLRNLLDFKPGSALSGVGDALLGGAFSARRSATNAAVADALLARSGDSDMLQALTGRQRAMVAPSPYKEIVRALMVSQPDGR